MKKLFENANFGDLYRSKDGTLNVFCKRFHETDIVLIRQSDDAIGYFPIRVNSFCICQENSALCTLYEVFPDERKGVCRSRRK